MEKQELIIKLVEELKNEGFDDELLTYYTHSIIGDEYEYDPNEISAYIYHLRSMLNKTSGQNITVPELVKLTKENRTSAVDWMMIYILQSGKSAQEILNSVNSYAVNNKNNNINQPKVA
mgnify:CR=1 FL=1